MCLGFLASSPVGFVARAELGALNFALVSGLLGSRRILRGGVF